MSGVVLAGANLPPEFDNLGLPTGEDGILTGEEVIDMDLANTELVVLSACGNRLGCDQTIRGRLRFAASVPLGRSTQRHWQSVEGQRRCYQDADDRVLP